MPKAHLLNDSCFVCTTWYHDISAPVPQLKPLGPTPALCLSFNTDDTAAFLLACVALHINAPLPSAHPVLLLVCLLVLLQGIGKLERQIVGLNLKHPGLQALAVFLRAGDLDPLCALVDLVIEIRQNGLVHGDVATRLATQQDANSPGALVLEEPKGPQTFCLPWVLLGTFVLLVVVIFCIQSNRSESEMLMSLELLSEDLPCSHMHLTL